MTLLLSHNCSSRTGHNNQNGGEVVFNSYSLYIDKRCFTDTNNEKWNEVYGDVSEDIPRNMPGPRGNPVDITMFIDAAFARDLVTHCSHTGIIIFINNAPIYWFSKQQTTVEASTFDSDFVALQIAIKMNDALQYKLQMMGMSINNTSNVMCDNNLVVCNVTRVKSILKKKHLLVVYHKV